MGHRIYRLKVLMLLILRLLNFRYEIRKQNEWEGIDSFYAAWLIRSQRELNFNDETIDTQPETKRFRPTFVATDVAEDAIEISSDEEKASLHKKLFKSKVAIEETIVISDGDE